MDNLSNSGVARALMRSVCFGWEYSRCFALYLCISLVAAPLVAESDNNTKLPSSPDDGGPRRFELRVDDFEVFAAPSFEAEKINDVSRHLVFSNLGCSIVAKLGWCEVRSIRGSIKGFVLATQVQPAEGPDGIVPMGVDDSKGRARKLDFDAMSEIACAQEQGQAMARCKVAIAQSGGGDATAVVTFSNGFARDLYFVHGEFLRGSATMSGVGIDTDWKLENGMFAIRVDDQRFELPSALIFGE